MLLVDFTSLLLGRGCELFHPVCKLLVVVTVFVQMRHILGLLLFELLLVAFQYVRAHFPSFLHESVFLHVFEVGEVVFLGLVPKLGIAWTAEVNAVCLETGFIRLVVFFVGRCLLLYLLLQSWLWVGGLFESYWAVKNLLI